MAQGKFITFEGGEGAGKSTQIRLLAARLEEGGIDVVLTREPGGAPQAEIIRELLVTGPVDRWSAQAEALLNYAARDDHLRSTIRPALDAGKWVLCDRFSDSTRAYQGLTGGVDEAMIDAVHAEIVGETNPDLTLIMDLDAEAGLARAEARGDANRFENKGIDFHCRLRDAFMEIAKANPDRCVVIDASGSVGQIAEEIFKQVDARLLSR